MKQPPKRPSKDSVYILLLMLFSTTTFNSSLSLLQRRSNGVLVDAFCPRSNFQKTQRSITWASSSWLHYYKTSRESSTVVNEEVNFEPQLSKERPYGFLVAEKVAELFEGGPRDGGCHLLLQEQQQDRKKKNAPQDMVKANKKEKVVVLGTGWGSTAFLKNVDTNLYHVTVISPRNYFLFTPMLAGATVGTVEYRSITEPVREINGNVAYLEGKAVYIDTTDHTVIVKPVECDSNNAPCTIDDHNEIPYDRLIYAIGAKPNTFGIPGVEEHCNFLKQVGDARKIRAAIVNCFERASFPDLTEAEQKKILTFAVIGAGPSGIEFAAELRDFIEQDGPRYYPDILKNVRIKVIEGSDTVLAPFHKSLQKEAIAKLNSKATMIRSKGRQQEKLLPPRLQLTELMLESYVKEITEDSICLTDGSNIPYGMAVWAAGNAPMGLTLDLIDDLGMEQGKHQNIARGQVATDPWLRAVGSNDGSIFVIGDASCVLHNHLPATGQVASQQGEYVARLLNKQYDLAPSPLSSTNVDDGVLPPPTRIPNITQRQTISDSIASLSTKTSEYAKPFQFLNLGIMAYTGRDTALAQIATPWSEDNTTGGEPIMATGKVGNELWKTVYLWKQVSWRNRIMVVSDWIKRQIFGRDITHLE